MTKRLVVWCTLIVGALVWSAITDAKTEPAPRPVLAIQIEGVISPSTADYIIRAIKQADREVAQALIIELDTPGGLDLSMRSIIKEMLAAERPIIVYVSPKGARAASAGAFITLAAHVAAMAPGTNIGAAHPVNMGGPMDKEMTKKVTNDAAAYIRTIAEQRGRNVQWAEDAVRKSVSATEKEALTLKIIDLVADRLDDLLVALDGREVTTAGGTVILHTKGVEVSRIDMSLRDKILKVISDPTIAYMLLMLGLAGLYFELSTPGAILPGVLGGICLILAFYAFQTLPINYAGLLLILLAIILFIAEIKVTSYGMLAVGGIIAMILGSMMLIKSPAPFMRISLPAIILTTGATAAFFLFIVAMALRAQHQQTTTGAEGLIGQIGTVRTPLKPEGSILVGGELWSARCEEGAEPGDKVRIRTLKGLLLFVSKDHEAVAVEADAMSTQRQQGGQA
ncbi:MAG: serine protease [Candidatus Methylomirabilota bacterium]|nr:nodulation protein NfeD [Candidatus Methylomirabilis sp.]NJD67076.1 nodulation protein NfeD [candidate division NC10 bacterium]PWB48730.1 MAG: serine protease [candidate division NC10 bacterium]